MDFSKLEQVDSFTSIVDILERGASFGGDIWQLGVNGERLVFPATHISVDLLQQKIHFNLSSPQFLEGDFSIFVRLRYRNIIFRPNPGEFVFTKQTLSCSIPSEIRALPVRTSERYVLPQDSDISLTLKRFARTVSERTPELEVRILDISLRGIGIALTGGNRDFLNAYDHLWIKAIDHQNLSYDILGTVLYKSSKSIRVKRSDVRLGLSLSQPLNWDIYQSLKKKCRIILNA